MVLAIFFAVPASAGAVCAVVCLLLRRLVPGWTALGHAAWFLVATGLGVGTTASAMHWRGYRIETLKAVYDVPQREFLDLVLGRSTAAGSADRETCVSCSAPGER
ncbi:MAG TPA: hypothetical protein VHC22_29785 [Pirellulales bacterium]|nr:hypothetical protein [Pirellulales bacterium]